MTSVLDQRGHDGPDELELALDDDPPIVAGSWVDRVLGAPLEAWLTFAVVGACVVFTFAHLRPGLIVADTTPAGGDMGAHVWGPAYLRDHLLPNWRLTGWSPDWYAGFPAFHFYMLPPALLIVALNVGFTGVAAVVFAAVVAWATSFGARRLDGARRTWLLVVAAAVLVVGVGMPYGIAMKLVTVMGVLALPVGAWAMGRLADMPFPGPPLLAVATIPFLFDTSFTIYGGNIPSTLAGEYSFSISLALTLLYFGLLARALRTGEGRALAAGVLSLAILCHAIPAFFAIAGTVVLLLLNLDWARLRFTTPIGVVGCALAGFWALPFVLRRGYMNDMGFGELTDHGDPLLRPDAQWLLALALVGLVLSIAFRIKLGLFLGVLAAIYAGAFMMNAAGPVNIWNARLLPFYYLCLYMLAAIGVTEVGRSIGFLAGFGVAGRSMRPVSLAVLVATVLVTWVVVSLPLRSLPFGGISSDGTTYRWLGLETTNHSFIQSWARWNYKGYERKDAYPEYYAIVSAMDRLGQERGCGRAHWEYDGKLDRYGTPMALMLLPFWTDGCIGSSEGLYFESSTTTAFHFLNASEVSAAPSNPQRDLPYSGFNLDDGVEHMRLLGIRYYMAFSAEALSAADDRADLTRVASEPPWAIYEIAGHGTVAPLAYEPAVLADGPTKGEGWLGVAVDWYEDPTAREVPLAASGPESWQRVAVGEEPERIPLDEVAVTNVVEGDLELSFDVDQVGLPVLVKTSYFPNWTASGADGPYRVTPNLMVVVPTSNHVELHYGYTPVDGLGWLLTITGIAGLLLLKRRGRVDLPEQRGPFDGEGFDDLAWLAPQRLSSLGAESAAEADEPGDGAQRPAGDGGTGRTQLLDPDADLRDL